MHQTDQLRRAFDSLSVNGDALALTASKMHINAVIYAALYHDRADMRLAAAKADHILVPDAFVRTRCRCHIQRLEDIGFSLRVVPV